VQATRISPAEIKIEVDRRATLIEAVGNYSLPTYGRTKDGARPHIEVDLRGYHFVVVESEQEFFTTRDLDELLYRVFQSVTHELAFVYELAHRVGMQDCRWLAFQQQVELLAPFFRLGPTRGARTRPHSEKASVR
jgi:Immunity protein 63/Peptidase family M54